MSLNKSKKSASDWGWLQSADAITSDDLSINGIGVLAIHLHRLLIDQSFLSISTNQQQEFPIDTFRICVSAYGLSRYSKTVRVCSTGNLTDCARFDQTMQMMIRIYDKRHDQRHSIHVTLYGYLHSTKRYVRITDQVVDCIKLASIRHIAETVVFEGSVNIPGKATLLIELVFVYGRHGYNFSSQLIFQNDIHLSHTVKSQTLFERILPTDEDNKINGKLFDPPEMELPIFLKLSFDELNEYVMNIHLRSSNQRAENIRVLRALSASSKYSSLAAILEMYPSKRQCSDMLFDLISEGPFLPEQNIIEPTAASLLPWSITYWNRGLSGVPLHGNALNMNELHNIEAGLRHLENTSPILRQILEREQHRSSEADETDTLKMIRELVRRVMVRFFQSDLSPSKHE